LKGLRSDLIDHAIAARHGRIVEGAGDGSSEVHGRAMMHWSRPVSVFEVIRCAIRRQ
jgi:hypothetical protein